MSSKERLVYNDELDIWEVYLSLNERWERINKPTGTYIDGKWVVKEKEQ
jgi:hypothetical protein